MLMRWIFMSLMMFLLTCSTFAKTQNIQTNINEIDKDMVDDNAKIAQLDKQIVIKEAQIADIEKKQDLTLEDKKERYILRKELSKLRNEKLALLEEENKKLKEENIQKDKVFQQELSEIKNAIQK